MRIPEGRVRFRFYLDVSFDPDLAESYHNPFPDCLFRFRLSRNSIPEVLCSSISVSTILSICSDVVCEAFARVDDRHIHLSFEMLARILHDGDNFPTLVMLHSVS